MLRPGLKRFAVSEDYYLDKDKYNEVFERAKSYHIWSFQQIGLFDPFPREPMETDFAVP